MTPPAAEQVASQVRFLLSTGACVFTLFVLFVAALVIGIASSGSNQERYK